MPDHQTIAAASNFGVVGWSPRFGKFTEYNLVQTYSLEISRSFSISESVLRCVPRDGFFLLLFKGLGLGTVTSVDL